MTLTRTLGRVLTLLAAILPLAQNLAHSQAAPVTIASKATGFERRDGFIPVYVDAKSGKLLLELPKDSTRALLMVSQATGFGSNPIGIDRGASGGTNVVRRIL